MDEFSEYLNIVLTDLLAGNIKKPECVAAIKGKTERMELRLEELETLDEERKYHGGGN